MLHVRRVIFSYQYQRDANNILMIIQFISFNWKAKCISKLDDFEQNKNIFLISM